LSITLPTLNKRNAIERFLAVILLMQNTPSDASTILITLPFGDPKMSSFGLLGGFTSRCGTGRSLSYARNLPGIY